MAVTSDRLLTMHDGGWPRIRQPRRQIQPHSQSGALLTATSARCCSLRQPPMQERIDEVYSGEDPQDPRITEHLQALVAEARDALYGDDAEPS